MFIPKYRHDPNLQPPTNVWLDKLQSTLYRDHARILSVYAITIDNANLAYTDIQPIIVPHVGRLTAITASLASSALAGSIIAEATINTTPTGLAVQLDTTNPDSNYTNTLSDNNDPTYSFNAGDAISIRFTTIGFDPVAPDNTFLVSIWGI